jgi:hypothetical protein
MYRALYTPEACTITPLNNYLHRPRRTRPCSLKGPHRRASTRSTGVVFPETEEITSARAVSESPTTGDWLDQLIEARLSVLTASPRMVCDSVARKWERRSVQRFQWRVVGWGETRTNDGTRRFELPPKRYV